MEQTLQLIAAPKIAGLLSAKCRLPTSSVYEDTHPQVDHVKRTAFEAALSALTQTATQYLNNPLSHSYLTLEGLSTTLMGTARSLIVPSSNRPTESFDKPFRPMRSREQMNRDLI